MVEAWTENGFLLEPDLWIHSIQKLGDRAEATAAEGRK